MGRKLGSGSKPDNAQKEPILSNSGDPAACEQPQHELQHLHVLVTFLYIVHRNFPHQAQPVRKITQCSALVGNIEAVLYQFWKAVLPVMGMASLDVPR